MKTFLLVLSCLFAQPVFAAQVIEGVAESHFGYAYISLGFSGPPEGQQQQYKFEILGGGPVTSARVNQYAVYRAYNHFEDHPIFYDDTCYSGEDCWFGSFSSDNKTFTAIVKTPLDEPAEDFGYGLDVEPFYISIYSDVQSLSAVPYRLTISAVPELATWAMMVMGIGAPGVMMRRRNVKVSRLGLLAPSVAELA